MRVLLIISAVVVACGPPKPSPKLAPLPDDTKPVEAPKPPVDLKEDWSATLAMPHDLVSVVIHFTGHDSTWNATMDIPGAAGIPLTGVTHSDKLLGFVLAKPAAPQMNETYKFERAGDTATGVVVIANQPFYAKMLKLAAGEAPKPAIARPQTPKPPFPYGSREVTITAPENGSLAGTLTIPEGKGPFPAILLVSGSGQQDRDETIFGHKAFAVLADRFTRDGIAVLRTDDRGIGKTTGALGSLDTDIGDARAAIEWMLKQPEIDPKRVGILGHSIGGVIAPIVAERTGKIAFIVALAGPGVSGVELVPMQLELELKIRKAPDAIIKVIVASQYKVGAAIAKGKEADVKVALRQSAIETAAAMGAPKPSDAELDAAVTAQLPSVANPWVISFFKTDPQPAWRKIKSPVLLVIGEKDTQVPADINIAKVKDALKRAGNRDVTAEKRPGLNHLYQHADTGLLDEYGMIEETFDPATLDLVSKWLVSKSKKR
jgi:uncharacterized protein